MRGYMIIAQPHSLFFLLSILFVVACILTTTTLSNPEGLTLNLIHIDIIYPPKNTSGFAGLSKAKNTNQNSYHKKQVGKLKSVGPLFLVEYYIGTPRIRQFAILDTGSSLLLVECTRPTPGHNRLSDFYNESTSHSYIPSSSNHEYCAMVSGHRRDAKGRCGYNTTFLDKSRSTGHIGFETIVFLDVGRRNQSAIIRNVLFGCGTDNYSPYSFEEGIFGIGGLLPLSIVKTRFSFCFGSINDPSNRDSHLALGSDARLEGNSVPYQTAPGGGRFGITFNSISIGSPRLNLRNFTVYIDSGASVSLFQTNVYNTIKSKVSKTIATHMIQKNSTYFKEGLCYEQTNIWKAFPSVIIESGGLHLLVLNIDGMFTKTYDNAFCLAIKPSVGPNLLGAAQMQYHNVGFDLISMRAYFQRKTTCNRD